jgi:hypothetical protein
MVKTTQKYPKVLEKSNITLIHKKIKKRIWKLQRHFPSPNSPEHFGSTYVQWLLLHYRQQPHRRKCRSTQAQKCPWQYLCDKCNNKFCRKGKLSSHTGPSHRRHQMFRQIVASSMYKLFIWSRTRQLMHTQQHMKIFMAHW